MRSGGGRTASINSTPSPAAPTLRLAYFSPLPPVRSGIADYSDELLPHLATRCELTVFATAGQRPTADLPVRPLDDYPVARWDYDLALYHIGNSTHHSDIYRLALRHPGVVVLHDLYLHHFIAETTAGRDDVSGYVREMAYGGGPDGLALARRVRDGRAAMPLFEEPLNRRLVDVSLGVIVHSRYAAARLAQLRPDLPLAVIPQPIRPYSNRSRRAELSLPDETVLFATVGQVTAAKQLPAILRALRGLLDAGLPVHLLIVGEALPEVDLDGQIAALSLRDHVTRRGYAATLDEFNDWIATADAVINLRRPTIGETSAAALRTLAAGRALVVYDHGWYSEIPDDAALKLPPQDDAALQEALERLARSADLRRRLGAAGARYTATTCSHDAAADAYIAFLQSIVGRWQTT